MSPLDVNDFSAPQPQSEFPYSMKTQDVFEHSRGVAWTATLYCGTEKVGFIEQDGTGGADRISFYNQLEEAKWNEKVEEAFSGNHESASFYLLVQEEEKLAR